MFTALLEHFPSVNKESVERLKKFGPCDRKCRVFTRISGWIMFLCQNPSWRAWEIYRKYKFKPEELGIRKVVMQWPGVTQFGGGVYRVYPNDSLSLSRCWMNTRDIQTATPNCSMHGYSNYCIFPRQSPALDVPLTFSDYFTHPWIWGCSLHVPHLAIDSSVL